MVLRLANMTRAKKAKVTILVFVVVASLGGAVGYQRYRVSRPAYRLRHGQEALLRGDPVEARNAADLLAAAGCADEAHLLRGQTHLHQGLLNEAIIEYNQINHDREDVLVEASRIYGLGLLSARRPIEAEKLLRYVLYVRPDDIDAHRGLATIAYDRGAMSEALVFLERWAELDDQDGLSHRFMGVIYKDLEHKSQAEEQYRLALERRLSRRIAAQVAVELAEVLIKRVEYAAALECLDGRFFLDVDVPTAVPELRAQCLYGLGRPAEASQILDQVLNGDAPSPRAYHLRAQIHAAANETAVAAALLEKALRIDPHDSICRYQLAQTYIRIGRKADAEEQRSLLDHTQRLLQALGDLGREANEKPRDSQVRLRLAEVCEQLNKYDMAQMWRRAAESCQTEASKDLAKTEVERPKHEKTLANAKAAQGK
jgi:tetratricopeptide (TPR) repeat protein